MTEIQVSTNIIKAVLTHAAKDDARFYLNGIHFRNQNGVLVIEATDGTRAIKVTLNKIKLTEPLSGVISRTDITTMLKWKEKTLTFVFSDTTVTETSEGDVFNLVDKWYVNIDVVLPDKKPYAKYLQGSYILEQLIDQRDASNLIFGESGIAGNRKGKPSIVQFSALPDRLMPNTSSPCFHDKTKNDIRVEGVVMGLRFQD